MRRHLGLDSDPQWVIFGEVNLFTWPGFDLRPVPGGNSAAYGVLPETFFETVRRGVLAYNRAKRAAIADRD